MTFSVRRAGRRRMFVPAAPRRVTRFSTVLRRALWRGGSALAVTTLVLSSLWMMSAPAAQAEVRPVSDTADYVTADDVPAPIPTTTALTASPPDGQFGQSVTLIATVTPAVPGGTVNFTRAGQPVVGCTGVPLSGPTATCPVVGLDVGAHSFVAAVNGSAPYLPSASAPIPVTIAAVLSALDYTGADSGQVGQPLSAAAKLTNTANGQALAGHALTFALPGGGSCNGTTDTGGTASCALVPHVSGSVTLTVSYAGSTRYLPQQITPAITIGKNTLDVSYVGGTDGTVGSVLVLVGKATDHLSGDSVSGLPLTLSFQGLSCTATTDANGVASCNVFVRLAGTSDVTVAFAGDEDYSATNGSSPATIAKAQTVTTVTVDPVESDLTVPVTVTATVTPTDGGTVAFGTTGTTLPGCAAVPLVQHAINPSLWTASCTSASLPAGDIPISATFSGTNNYSSSVGSAMTTVAPAQTSLSYTGDTSGIVGAPLAVSAMLTNIIGTNPISMSGQGMRGPGAFLAAAPAPGVDLAGQRLQFALGTAQCEAVTDANGAASCSLIPALADSAAQLLITFTGTDNLNRSELAVGIAVAAAPTVAPAPDGLLATTGSDLGSWPGAAVLLLGAGGLLLIRSRRRAQG